MADKEDTIDMVVCAPIGVRGETREPGDTVKVARGEAAYLQLYGRAANAATEAGRAVLERAGVAVTKRGRGAGKGRAEGDGEAEG